MLPKPGLCKETSVLDRKEMGEEGEEGEDMIIVRFLASRRSGRKENSRCELEAMSTYMYLPTLDTEYRVHLLTR